MTAAAGDARGRRTASSGDLMRISSPSISTWPPPLLGPRRRRPLPPAAPGRPQGAGGAGRIVSRPSSQRAMRAPRSRGSSASPRHDDPRTLVAGARMQAGPAH